MLVFRGFFFRENCSLCSCRYSACPWEEVNSGSFCVPSLNWNLRLPFLSGLGVSRRQQGIAGEEQRYWSPGVLESRLLPLTSRGT